MIVPEGALFPADTSEIALRALVGGQFQLPKDTELVSGVYAFSVSKPLLKPVKLEIQHCVNLVTRDHTSYLSFATASIKQSTTLPYKFQLQEGGQFNPDDRYGRISLPHFCLEAIVKSCPPIDGSPDNDYVGQVVYENRKNNKWLTHFMAAKHLNILIEVNTFHTFILNIPHI